MPSTSRPGSVLALLSFARRRIGLLVAASAGVVLLAGAGFAAWEENTVSTYGDGVWWALSLMTTVGFVGETPEGVGGKILSAILMVTGFAMMSLVTAAISSIFVRQQQEPGFEEERALELAVEVQLRAISDQLVLLSRATAEVQEQLDELRGTSAPGGA